MSKKKPKSEQPKKESRRKTPTVLLELPLVVNEGQAKRLRGHLEAGRALYNAVLSEGQKRLRRMRADPAWQAARSIPRTQKQKRQAAFSALRQRYGFSEYALHEYAKTARVCWIADHLDAVLPKPWPRVPITPSTASVWEKRAACASRAGDEDWGAWRTNATIPDCVSCCKSQRRAIEAF